MSYSLYLGTTLLPIPPSKLQVKIEGNNNTVSLINEGEINILKKAGLSTVEFDATLPNVRYPFATYKAGFQRANYFLNELEKLKMSQKAFQFIVSRSLPNGTALFNTNLKVSLESYTIKEETKIGFDVVVSVKLKQYRDFGTKTVVISTKTATVSTTREMTNSPAPASPQTYTVKGGDSLWKIAKSYYGNGSQYTKIYDANKDKIKNPSLIYPGQVLTIPV